MTKWFSSYQLTTTIKILLIGAILVLLLLAFFSQPAADDYGQSHRIRTMGFWKILTHWYNNMNGRFFYMVAFSIYSVIFGLSNYWIFTWLMYGSFVLSVYLLFYTLGFTFFSKQTLLWSSLAFSLIYVRMLPILSETFYWLSGAMTYQVGNTLFVLLIAVLCLLSKTSSQKKRFLYTTTASLIAAATIGSNEIFIFPVCASLILCIVFLSLEKNPSFLFAICILLISCISANFVVTAPSIYLRSLHFPNRHQVGFSFVSSIREAFHFFKQWIFDPVVLSSSFLLLTSVSKVVSHIKIPEKERKILFLLPAGWLSIFIFFLFPTFWATGILPPHRALNSFLLFFLLGWYLSIYILTILYVSRQKSNIFVSQPIRNIVMIIFISSLLGLPNLSTATKDLLFYAYPYHQEVKDRIKSTQKSISEDQGYVVIRPLKNRPVSLFSPNFEFKGDPDYWVDYDWELYWGLKVIFINESDTQ